MKRGCEIGLPDALPGCTANGEFHSKGQQLAECRRLQPGRLPHENQAIDVIEVLVGGDRPCRYWRDFKKKLVAEGYFEVSEKIGRLKMLAPDGKQRLTDCANTETLFRVIQSIPSPKVEPLQRWLTKVGKERLDEIENPELAMGRPRARAPAGCAAHSTECRYA